MSADVADGDLARLARGGDPVAFRLLVERHQPMVRARARQLAPDPGDVDDIVQESFLQAFLALDRLRDPDRFAGWLAGIVHNVCRSLHRRAPVTLLADWPEPLHPTSAGGLPSAEDLDRADALRAAVARLPAGQRRAVTLHYYADMPAGQVAEPPGAARASLHKARLRLRAYLTEHRPDLVPASGRTHMTTVRVARIERRIPPGPVPDRVPTHVMVLADDAGHRNLPIWLLGQDSHRFADDARPGPNPDELTDRLLRAAGARVTAVDVDELGPEVTVTRIELATPAGPEHITARLLDGLAVAITTGAPIRVADAVMDRMAVPAGAGQAGPVPAGAGQVGPMPEQTARDLSIDLRPRYEPRNLTFAAGLDHWVLGGSFTEHAAQSHWQDYSAAAQHGTAVLSAAVPQPEGFAWLAQEIFADDYRGGAVTFRGQFRIPEATGLAGLFLRVMTPRDLHGPVTMQAALADPANHIVTLEGPGDWTAHEVTAPIPDDANTVAFGLFQAGPGQIELRDPELTHRPAHLAPAPIPSYSVQNGLPGGPAQPSPVDPDVPSPARMWNYWLGGTDNFPVDRELAERVQAAMPSMPLIARFARLFLADAVRRLLELGIRQFLDIGSGVPTADNTHQVAQRLAPESRVVYADRDPTVALHARSLLSSTREGRTDYLHADLRDPEAIRTAAARTLDLTRPVGVLLIAVLHFIPELEDPYQIVARLMAGLPSGSYLVIAHAASDLAPEAAAEMTRRNNQTSPVPITPRTRAQVTRFFEGLDVMPPGVVPVSEWDLGDAMDTAVGGLVGYSGIGRKP